MPSIRIILADDHDLVRAGIRNALQGVAGMDIIAEVGTGVDLFTALEAYDANFLLMDVNMPDFEPLSEIHRITESYPDMRILIVSAYDDYVYVQGLLSAGANGYHLKDQPLSDLKLAIERIMQGERWISSPLLDKLLTSERSLAKGPTLSRRQRDIAQCLLMGLSNREIAMRLHLSVKTIENHLTRLYNLLNVNNRMEALNTLYEQPDLLGGVQQKPGTAPLQLDDTAPAERTTILIVDDNQRYRSQLHHLVEKAHPGSRILEASNQADALNTVGRIDPDIVFVDVVLGNENGIECARQIHAVNDKPRIVLISAYPDREFHRLGLEAGAAAFIDKKDLDIATMAQIIQDAI